MIYEKELSDKIIDCAFEVHKTLGYGFLEKVYENSLKHEIEAIGLKVAQQAPIQVIYKNIIAGDYRADLFVENKIILELKAEKQLNPAHEAQLLNYLKATNIKVGYLVNFGRNKLEFKRMVF